MSIRVDVYLVLNRKITLELNSSAVDGAWLIAPPAEISYSKEGVGDVGSPPPTRWSTESSGSEAGGSVTYRIKGAPVGSTMLNMVWNSNSKGTTCSITGPSSFTLTGEPKDRPPSVIFTIG